MRVVLNTCILKLATFPADNDASAVIYELARAGLNEAWVSTANYWQSTRTSRATTRNSSLRSSRASRDPLTELAVIQHEPDNRFLECASGANAEFIVTVNTAPGHFGRGQVNSRRSRRWGDR